MAKSRQPKKPESNEGAYNDMKSSFEDPFGGIVAPGTTGRYLVLMREDGLEAGTRALSDTLGLNVIRAAELEGSEDEGEQLASAEAISFESLAVVVVDMPPEQTQALRSLAAEENAILAIEPERIVRAIEDWPVYPPSPPPPTQPSSGSMLEYLRGYRDAVNYLVDRMIGGTPDEVAAGRVGPKLDESEQTWGVQLTKATASRFSGHGIRVAVLDTGLDLGHPDFAGRRITHRSFIRGQEVQDGNGHGTHCIGTSCGSREPGRLPRYGVAPDAEIFAGKVLSNQGSGTDGGILAGIQWAINNGCQIISMSLGSPVRPGEGFSRIYEFVARRALAAGTLIIAAAGNESSRPFSIRPVGHPANCPSILAVGAIDEQLRIASFSNGGLNPSGGQVDVAGPGVDVYSSWPRPTLYDTISGTSMATPHVAGIAALFAEADSEMRGRALASILIQSARRLSLPSRDVGSGLVQAP